MTVPVGEAASGCTVTVLQALTVSTVGGPLCVDTGKRR